MKNIIVLFVAFSFCAEAGINKLPKRIARKIEKKLLTIEEKFNRYENFHTPILYKDSNETAYYLKRIRLQLSPFAAFGLPVLELKIIPMVEFRWTRKNPKGWINYQRTI